MPDRTLLTPADLIAARLLPAEQQQSASEVAARYAIAVPRTFASFINGANDPIGLQVLF